MARIRTVKPEFWVSEQVVECSITARLLFVGMLNFADDNGVHSASAKRLKMSIFPGDAFTTEQVEEWICELETNELVKRFEADGRSWLWITGFSRHQRIDRPSKSQNPLPPGSENDAAETTIRRGLDEDSTSDRHQLDDGREGKGREGKGVSTVAGDGPQQQESEEEATAIDWTFPTKNGGTFVLTPEKLTEYRTAYPSLDVECELLRARQWCKDNPAKRKTNAGMPRFLNGWLAKPQPADSTGSGNRGALGPPSNAAGEDAWQRVTKAVKRFDPLHEADQLRQHLTAEERAAATSVGGLTTIAARDRFTDKTLRSRFLEAFQERQRHAKEGSSGYG
ncbi:MAG: hypothetical protein Fues2KO_52890 [Fuerstiella sp.]